MNTFENTLSYALMADYFNISFMTTNGRGKDLNMLCSKYVFFHFQALLVDLGNSIKVFEYTNDKDFVWINFNDSDAKEVVSDYFENFNLANRMGNMIIMPDVHEGEKIQSNTYAVGIFLRSRNPLGIILKIVTFAYLWEFLRMIRMSVCSWSIINME